MTTLGVTGRSLSLAIQPGSGLEWTLTAALDGAVPVVTEALSDGQHFDSGFAPIVTATLGTATVWRGTVQPTLARDSATGVSTLLFDLAAAGVTGQVDAVAITDRSVIDAILLGPHSGSPLLGQGDRLTESGTIAGTTASASLAVPTSSATLGVAAVNGRPVTDAVHAAIGDAVTYHAVIDLPLSTTHALRLTTTGPGPGMPLVFDNTRSGYPAIGHAQWDGGASYTATVPTIAIDAAGALTFSFGDILPVYGSGPASIGLLYTTILTHVDDPAAPVPSITLGERNGTGVLTQTTAAAPALVLDQPSLHLQTASLYVSDDNAIFAGSGGPFGFSPETGQFGGVISSAGLATDPFDDSLIDIVAQDIVTFVVTIENTAHAAAYGVTLRETLPPGFVLPADGADISVVDGAGNLLDYSGDLFDPQGGLALGPAVAIGPYDPDSGANIAVVTFTLQAADTVPLPHAALGPVATLVRYAAEPGNCEVTQVAGVSASTTVTSAAPLIAIANSGPATVTAGQTVAFDVTLTMAEGQVRDLRLADLLPAGLSFVSAQVTAIGSHLTVATPAPVADAQGTLGFGAVTDAADGVIDDNDRIKIHLVAHADAALSGTIQAIVSAADPAGGPRWSAQAGTAVAAIGPQLTLAASAPAVAQAGQTIPITLTVANAAGAAPAFNLRLADALAPGLTLVPGSVTATLGATVSGTGATLAQLNAGQTLTLSALAKVAPDATLATAIGATATLTSTTLADPAMGQTDTRNATAAVAVTAAAVTIAPSTTQLKIGDVTTIGLVVTLPKGASPTLQITDALPPGLNYVAGSARVVSVGTGVVAAAPTVTVAGQAVTFDFGPVTGPASGTGQLALSLQARADTAAPLGPVVNGVKVASGYASTAAAAATLTVVNTPPQITGLAASVTTNDHSSIAPFTGLRLTDPDGGGSQQQTATIQLSDPSHGRLAAITDGSYDPASGTYRITGTTASIATAIGGLRFVPQPHLGPVGQPVATDLTLLVTDAAGGQASAVVHAAAITSNSLPAIAGTLAGQETTTRIAVLPFTGLVLSDPDIGQGGTLTIRLTDRALGSLSGPAIGSYDGSTGIYTARGSLADLQAAARSLLFTPARFGNATFAVALDDGAGGIANDARTAIRIEPSADTSNIATHYAPAPGSSFLTAANGGQTVAQGEVYAGPVSSLASQFIYDGTSTVVIVTAVPSVFIKSFSGFDAIQVTSGTNVIDAGPGSNFIVGGTGNDTFFLDGTHGDTVWDTIVGFHPGDMVTLFGFHPGVSSFRWADNEGTAGFTGSTLHADLAGNGQSPATLTFAGTTATDTARYAISTGTVGGVDYLAITGQ